MKINKEDMESSRLKINKEELAETNEIKRP